MVAHGRGFKPNFQAKFLYCRHISRWVYTSRATRSTVEIINHLFFFILRAMLLKSIPSLDSIVARGFAGVGVNLEDCVGLKVDVLGV